MASKKKSNRMNALYVHSKDSKVYLKTDNEANEWYPINFQWIPIIDLNKNMNQ
ncbi:hypothetical protein Q4Q34_16880 [Flavivirga abyssicola]|uniref:hypothetical protein n=1 Tax=Flavivirga abyssicola TaxID=3063533 RepID=UPI0026E093D4|nr:hypothetical protein [Flavivirga sp. MEBiC07777]WVK12891.1 hypothetical protein Q4Q34_16880 [Flavivirga sp. MEBiC07777]